MCREFSSSGHQADTCGRASRLSAGFVGQHFMHEVVAKSTYLIRQRRAVLNLAFYEGRPCGSIAAGCRLAKVTREGVPIFAALQILEQAQTDTGIRGDIGHAYLLPCLRALAHLRHVFCQRYLTRRQEEHAPGLPGTAVTVAIRATFTAAICEHVCRFTDSARLHLPQFIEH